MSAEPGESFATLTHARLRAAQGDVGGATRILRVILQVQPAHREARELLNELTERVAVPHAEPAEERAAEVVPAAAGDLARRFHDALGANRRSVRVERLSLWLARTQRNRGARHVR
jgi:hypothetical protein